MPATKPAKPAAPKPPAVLGKSQCDNRGKELPADVFARVGQKVDAFFVLCAASADIRVTLRRIDPTTNGGTIKYEGTIPGDTPNPLTVPLVSLPVGSYLVTWLFTGAGDYQAVAELQVDGVTLFRKREDLGDGIPTRKIWCFLEMSE